MMVVVQFRAYEYLNRPGISLTIYMYIAASLQEQASHTNDRNKQ